MAAVSPMGEVWPVGKGGHTPAEWREACFHTSPLQVCGKQRYSGLLDQLPTRQATVLGRFGLRTGPDAPNFAAPRALPAA